MKHDYETTLGKILAKKKLTMAIAESCTGGMLGQRISSVSGSSRYFLGGIISYNDSVKIKQLGIDPIVLEQNGAVSEETANQMAIGVRHLFGADIGISITGIAGPSGGFKSKPIGLVFIGISIGKMYCVKKHMFCGGRGKVREQASQAALELVIDNVSTFAEK